MVFKKEGCSVKIGRNGKGALIILEQDPGCNTLSDIQMPEMDGRELLCEIKRRYRMSKVLMMSGNFFNLTELQLLGALDVVRKPIQMPDLLETITECDRTAWENRAGPYFLRGLSFNGRQAYPESGPGSGATGSVSRNFPWLIHSFKMPAICRARE